jgi:hypothetical protein
VLAAQYMIDNLPAGAQVHAYEFQVLLRFHHACSSLPSSQGERQTSSAFIAW